MSMSSADDLDILKDAALAAGRVAMDYFRNDVEVWWKNEGSSPVTAADHAANDVLKQRLLGARPDYGWLSEESEDDAARLDARRVFIIDPIDGTRAFMTGRDTWVVSAAIVEAGKPIAGVLYAPALQELFVANQSGMVEKNGKPLAVAPVADGGRFRLSAADDMVARVNGVLPDKVERLSRIPSLAYRLAMIADGRMDATLVKPSAHDWDLAAAELILRNAGGMLTDAAGEDLVYNRVEPRHGLLIAASRNLHPTVLAAMAASQ